VKHAAALALTLRPMDSLSQLALGAAVGVAVMGRRTAVWKAALWGAIAGTLPDLDVFIDHGDALRNMTMHRGASHALFWLTLAAPLLAALPATLHHQREQFARWWLAMGLALLTHPLLDAMTVYGTQLLLPFTDHPFGVGSMFIIDPLYTAPLTIGLGLALARQDWRGLRWNNVDALSTAYLAWRVVAQWHVREIAQEALAARGTPARRCLSLRPRSTPCSGGSSPYAMTAATRRASTHCWTRVGGFAFS
jgi:inner membrane protein